MWKERKKYINPLNINTFRNHYDILNEFDDIREMLKTNCSGKAPIKAALV